MFCEKHFKCIVEMNRIFKLRRCFGKYLNLKCILLVAFGSFIIFQHKIQINNVKAIAKPKSVLQSSLRNESDDESILKERGPLLLNESVILRVNSEGSLQQKPSENVQDHFMKTMKLRMEKRRKHLRKTCRKLGKNSSNKMLDVWDEKVPRPQPWMYASEHHGLLYMEIPKCGSSNWKKLLMVLNNMANFNDFADDYEVNPHSQLHPTDYYYATDKQKESYRKATKFIVVREPMERLVSVYKNKMALKPNFGYNYSVFGLLSWEITKRYGTRWKDPTTYLRNGLREIKSCRKIVTELTCTGQNKVIKVVSASFGRFNNKSCGEDRWWNGTSCFAKSAYTITSHLCNGKSHCKVPYLFRYNLLKELHTCVFSDKLVLTVLYKCISFKKSSLVTVCSSSSQKITCSSGKVISIAKVFYGRKDLKTCLVNAKIYHTHCVDPGATATVIAACDHKKSCIVYSSDDWLSSNVCPPTTKYLQVWYSCIESLEADREYTVQEFMLSEEDQKAEYEPLRKRIQQGLIEMKKEMTVLDETEHNSEDQTFSPVYRPQVIKNFPLSATFQEFVSYLLDPAKARLHDDVMNYELEEEKITNARHWSTYYNLTHPCHVDYDVIIHMETMDDDARYLLNLVGVPPSIQLPKSSVDETGETLTPTSQEEVKELFAPLSKEQTKKLLDMYSIDYRLFGYKFPKFE